MRKEINYFKPEEGLHRELHPNRGTPRLWFADFRNKQYAVALNRMLQKHFYLHLDPVTPEFLLCGTGHRHSRYSCPKILFVWENYFPDFGIYDYAFSFDRTEGRNFRLPLWAIQMGDPADLLTPIKDPTDLLESKKNFCAFVYSNPSCNHRNEFFALLSARKHVDSPGRLFTNMGGICDRYDLWAFEGLPSFYQNYKFTITFEHSTSPGFTTEKITSAFLGSSVPIYWGNPEIVKDFNPDSFINAHNFESLEKLVDYVMEVDANDELYLRYLTAPKFSGNMIPEDADWKVLAARLEYIFQQKIVPQTSRGLARHFPLMYSFIRRKIVKTKFNKLSRPFYPMSNPTILER